MPKKLEQGFSPFEQTIRIAYCPSRMVCMTFVVAHLLAFLSLILAGIFLWLKLLLAALMISALSEFYKDYSEQKGGRAGRELILDTHDSWHLNDHDEEAIELTLLPAAFVHPKLIVLRFVDKERQRYSFIFTKDNLNQDTLRRLGVRLRFNNGVQLI